MAFKKNLWWGIFSGNNFPSFPCPRCNTGHLRAVTNTLAAKDARHSLKHDPNDLPEDYIERQFVLLAECNNDDCGAVSSVGGHFSWEESDNPKYHLELAQNIDFITPAPPMIELPEVTPRDVRAHIEKSFDLYWPDRAACANRIRSAGESILDSMTVPKTKRFKAKLATSRSPAKAAKVIGLDFNGRIQWLAKRNKGKAKIIDALRRIGNLGSHGGRIDQDEIHGAMILLEYLVLELYGKHEILKLAEGLGKKTKA